MLEREISEFGQRLGLPDLAFDANGHVILEIDTVGVLHMERPAEQADSLHVYLAREAPPHDKGLARRALELCHYRQHHPFALAAALHRGQCLMLTRVDAASVTAPQLEQIILHLAATLDRAFQGA